MEQVQDLIKRIRQEAEREEFPIDSEVYHKAQLDPLEPILFHGDLQSPLCFFARDLGKDEVANQQPLYGAAGTMVRRELAKVLFQDVNPEKLQAAADKVLLTNTVPYKPPGNKAYSAKVKKRFRPFLEELLGDYWQGDYIIPLGAEALKWFAPYADKQEFKEFVATEQKYEQQITVELPKPQQEKATTKKITLAPLPHPSPLNQKYYKAFPEMLARRLDVVKEVIFSFYNIERI